MAWLTRRRNSKKLQARGSGGRYVRPTLGCEVCVHCRAIIMKTMGEGPFPMPEWPKLCHQCGKDWRK